MNTRMSLVRQHARRGADGAGVRVEVVGLQAERCGEVAVSAVVVLPFVGEGQDQSDAERAGVCDGEVHGGECLVVVFAEGWHQRERVRVVLAG